MKKRKDNSNKVFYAYLPKNFLIEEHIVKYSPDSYMIDPFCIDHCKYLLSQIYEVKEAVSYKNSGFSGLDGTYTQLQASVLQSVVQKYKSYIVYLLETGIIECDRQYIVSDHDKGIEGKSYGYRYTSLYENGDIISCTYSEYFNELLNKRMKRNLFNKYSNYIHLTKWLDYLDIDGKSANEYIATKRDAQLLHTHLIDKKRDVKTGRIKEINPSEQFKYSKIIIHKISSGNQFVHVDVTVHRMYTHLTSIKKELRNLITFKKNGIKSRLISIDIVNSQPYLLTMLLNINKKENLITFTDSLSYKQNNHTLLMLKKMYMLFENEGFIHQDVILYRSLVSECTDKPNDNNGNPYDLYTYMLSNCVARRVPFTSRSEIKKGMMGVMFGSNDANTKIKELFKELFPTVWEMICIIKSNAPRDLSCLLQSVEAHFVLRIITKNFAKKYRNAPLYTIHDSIVTTEEYKIRLVTHIYFELQRLVGLPPMLKIEEWLPENLNWGKYTNPKQQL